MISIYQISDAYKRISKYIYKTPIIHSDKLNKITGSNILIKAENLQKTGSFKIRGATNMIAQIKEEKVIAPSSGNHAQAVAAACNIFNKSATLIMPSDAPKSKIEGVKNNNIGDLKNGHVQARSILAQFYDHTKGPTRKNQGFSNENQMVAREGRK